MVSDEVGEWPAPGLRWLHEGYYWACHATARRRGRTSWMQRCESDSTRVESTLQTLTAFSHGGRRGRVGSARGVKTREEGLYFGRNADDRRAVHLRRPILPKYRGYQKIWGGLLVVCRKLVSSISPRVAGPRPARAAGRRPEPTAFYTSIMRPSQASPRWRPLRRPSPSRPRRRAPARGRAPTCGRPSGRTRR